MLAGLVILSLIGAAAVPFVSSEDDIDADDGAGGPDDRADPGPSGTTGNLLIEEQPAIDTSGPDAVSPGDGLLPVRDLLLQTGAEAQDTLDPAEDPTDAEGQSSDDEGDSDEDGESPQEVVFDLSPGTFELENFNAADMTLTLRIPEFSTGFLAHDADPEADPPTPSILSFEVPDGPVELRFPGVDQVPVGSVKLAAGGADPMPLSEFLPREEDALLPEAGDAPMNHWLPDADGPVTALDPLANPDPQEPDAAEEDTAEEKVADEDTQAVDDAGPGPNGATEAPAEGDAPEPSDETETPPATDGSREADTDEPAMVTKEG